MAGDMFEGFLTCFEVPNLLGVGHGFVCACCVHVAEQCCGSGRPASVVIKVLRTVFQGNPLPRSDPIGSVIRYEVVRDTCFLPDATRWRATSALLDCVALEVSRVLHHAGGYLADMRAGSQFRLLSLGEGESLCAHILNLLL